MKCPFCNKRLTKYNNNTTVEKLYYCSTRGCKETYRILASELTWKLLTNLLKEKKEKENETSKNQNAQTANKKQSNI